MIHSMTAFSKNEEKYTWGNVTWEICSLNQRYLDIHIDLPKYLYGLSWVIRKNIKDSLIRGRVECVLHIQINKNCDSNTETVSVNKPLVNNLVLYAKWIKTLTNEGEINPIDILSWPGVITYEKNNLDNMKNNVHSELLICFKKTLDNLIQDRKREGVFLKNKIIERLHLMYSEVNKIRQYIPNVLECKRKQLLEYMKDVCVYTDPARLEQELLMIAQKIDISEEVDRLTIHIKEMHRILDENGAVGRRLDFVIQELHREANTLTSKSINSYITQLAISLKIFIEQIREQTQNIE
ncbi:YicC family protein [Blochmannia endosymbiont of Camponotus sp. C-003]|uniref:YicC/YloC family endoribonuclease n=1 Tax=Blochmannia endosymbiont of Camponotus sp. C-003 TaxID=2945588 RepID=UPI0020242528|nr:YicC/YloC family endoribonuclease [Blochmannia endosymbiont of Camponotus sp. C-003]URJ23242.1 YicC family protein [Blochmannia endosymbiont of Camponotus sp. C-003]